MLLDDCRECISQQQKEREKQSAIYDHDKIRMRQLKKDIADAKYLCDTICTHTEPTMKDILPNWLWSLIT
jgi:hypothetical protein